MPEEIVMVVEDEQEARDFLVQILEFEGFKAIGFANGAEALAYLESSEQPCLIILDIRMPVMSGPEFREVQQQNPKWSAIPVVVVTAFEPSAAIGLSPLRIFRKPFDVRALVEVIRANC